MITDWSAAYDNRAHAPGAPAHIERWIAAGAAARAAAAAAGRAELDLAYGLGAREKLDLFRPEGAAQGLLVFVHGGYWRLLDRANFAQLCAGPLARGWAAALPSYPLAPGARISEITRAVAAAVSFAAARVAGPIRLAGHSAGGHLVTRMLCADASLAPEVRARIVHTVSISGVHDLRPLLKTAMNADLRLDAAEAAAESPALLAPVGAPKVSCWVGGAELPEFRRQNALLANVWTGLGAETRAYEDPGKTHFDVLDPLADPTSPLCGVVLE